MITKKGLLSNLPWINFCVGLVFICISMSEYFNSKISEAFEHVGYTLITAGVFASILKSFQFIGIFREELENVLLDRKFLENRTDLPQLWTIISRAIYKRKLPDISESLESIVLNSYFPTDHQFYYEEFNITVVIHELTDDNIIKFTQSVSAKVILAEGETEAKMSHHFWIDKEGIVDNDKVQQDQYIKIDEVKITVDPDIKFLNGQKCFTYNYTVYDKKTFLLEKKEVREYSIIEDNFKIFRVSNITKEMDVSVSFPSNVKVCFFDCGVVMPFEEKHSDQPNLISYKHKGSLILPKQGFGLTFARK